MNNTLVKSWCLNEMGITQWQRRHIQYDFWLIMSQQETQFGILDLAKQKLIERLLQALHWPQAQTKIELLIWEPASGPLFLKKLSTYAPKKILLFGVDPSTILCADQWKKCAAEIALLPSIKTLLTDLPAKKRAWQQLQSFIVTG